MQGLKNMLLQEKLHLQDVIARAKSQIEDVPEGYLRISKDKNQVRYYHCLDDRYGKYISKKMSN